MIAVNDLRQGILFVLDGSIYQVLNFRRHKMARAKAVVNVKIRDIQTNNVREITFKSSDSVEEADVESQVFDFVYHDVRREKVIMSDPETKKRIEVDASVFDSGQLQYLTDGVQLTAQTNGAPEDVIIYSVSLPNTVELTVTQAPPNDKGDTASGGSKPVVVSSGLTVNTPFFVSEGDVIRVNTTSGEYIERISQG